MELAWLLPLFIAGILFVIGGAVIRRFSRDFGDPLLLSGAAVLAIAAVVWLLAFNAARARDPSGQWAGSPLKGWFDGLRSGRGPCCSDADGSAVSDVDWEVRNGHYRVRLEGEWIDVPDDAVITEPNRAGRTMVWPMRGYMGLSIRCFMPGPQA